MKLTFVHQALMSTSVSPCTATRSQLAGLGRAEVLFRRPTAFAPSIVATGWPSSPACWPRPFDEFLRFRPCGPRPVGAKGDLHAAVERALEGRVMRPPRWPRALPRLLRGSSRDFRLWSQDKCPRSAIGRIGAGFLHQRDYPQSSVNVPCAISLHPSGRASSMPSCLGRGRDLDAVSLGPW